LKLKSRWAYDNWGSYHTVWLLLIGLAVVGIISISTITPDRPVKIADKKAPSEH